MLISCWLTFRRIWSVAPSSPRLLFGCGWCQLAALFVSSHSLFSNSFVVNAFVDFYASSRSISSNTLVPIRRTQSLCSQTWSNLHHRYYPAGLLLCTSILHSRGSSGSWMSLSCRDYLWKREGCNSGEVFTLEYKPLVKLKSNIQWYLG